MVRVLKKGLTILSDLCVRIFSQLQSRERLNTELSLSGELGNRLIVGHVGVEPSLMEPGPVLVFALADQGTDTGDRHREAVRRLHRTRRSARRGLLQG